MEEVYVTFETERLIVRPTSVEDCSFVLALFNTPKSIKYIGDRNIKTIEEAEVYIKKRMRSQLERLGYSNYTVIRKSDGAKIGCCGLYDREGVEGIDIGFSLLPEYEGKGYAYESVSKLKEIAENRFALTKIRAITKKDNVGSQKLLKKIGLEQIGVLTLPNETEELYLFSN
ncbi:GNAT family N-acetyltransferase [Aquimarina hainanensis]|uniref:GNAT family N-acetyltransferase n=1 Tax=Aquimarina hainanensis TaxID=1578017 RepID=A0ABW5NGB9_9FLAO|nr:GNAT family N-acetyltransferase [Aquimarina sp. TRL1]QKX07172.1 GNAT family N-acetyltransferase [Aquimarina sp. TRL1]